MGRKPIPMVYVHADVLAHDHPHLAIPEEDPEVLLDPQVYETLEAALWQPHEEPLEDDAGAVVTDAEAVLLPVRGIELDAS